MQNVLAWRIVRAGMMVNLFYLALHHMVKMPDKFVQQGSKQTYFYIRKNDLRFIDSLSFFLCPVAELSEMFDIETVKGFFPHKFNTLENQNYVGKIPAREMYGGDEVKAKKRNELNKWYDTVKATTDWNFRDEFIKYCDDDVQLLTESKFCISTNSE